MAIDWNGKLDTYMEAIVDLLFETLMLAIWLGVLLLLRGLVIATFGEAINEEVDKISVWILFVFTVIGGLDFTIAAYVRAKKRLAKIAVR